jgi:twinkle protein
MTSTPQQPTTDAFEWLEAVRGLDVELCARMGFRAAQDRHLGAGVAWPYRRGGETYAEKFRPLGDKTFRWHPKGVEHGLFNLDALADAGLRHHPAVLTEGEFDAVAVIQAGFPRTASLPDGWSKEADTADVGKMRPVIAAEAALRDSPCVILAGDADEHGAAFVRAVSALLEGHPVRVVSWPEGCKDANDTLRKHGAAEIVRCLNDARMIDPPGGVITGFSDLPPLSTRRILRLGVDPFDGGIAFEECAMSVCTGIPGHGKSTFVRWCAHHLVRNEGVRVGAMELEGNPAKMRDHLARLHTGRRWADLYADEQRSLERVLDEHWRVAHRAPEADIPENLEWLRKRIHALAVRDRCKFIYIDPWNELEHMPEKGESLTNYINFATKSIRQWAERYDTHVCVVAHPKKFSGRDGETIPDGYDVADSAAWVNKPALGFTVHQHDDAEDPHVRIRVWKVRDVEAYGFGRRTLKVDFDANAMTYRRRINA